MDDGKLATGAASRAPGPPEEASPASSVMPSQPAARRERRERSDLPPRRRDPRAEPDDEPGPPAPERLGGWSASRPPPRSGSFAPAAPAVHGEPRPSALPPPQRPAIAPPPGVTRPAATLDELAAAAAPPEDTVTAPGSAPPPSITHEAALEEKEHLGELTRQIVQTMNRKSYYEPGHPAYFIVRDELFDRLMGVLEGQPQVGYILQRSDPPEILVDGLGQGRVRMSDVLAGGVYELFVPRFIEYFDRHNLVLLAFRQGITREEFGAFLGILSRPVAGDRQFDLPAALLAEGVLHVSSLVGEDVGSRDTDLPWQVRICLARLRRDLRLVPMFRDLGRDVLRKAKQQIFSDTVRPLQNAELLKALVVHSPRIERDIAHIEGLEDLRITRTIVEVLAPRPLIDLARLLCEESVERGAEDAEARELLEEAIELAARRLAKEDPPDAEPVLRLLVQHRILGVADLPADLQDWLRAEELHLQADPSLVAGLPLVTARDAGVLCKLERLARAAGRVDRVVEVAARLATAAASGDAAAATARDELLDDRELAAVAATLEEVPAKDAGTYARLLALFGARGARVLGERLVAPGELARMGRAYHALEKMPEAAEVLPALLSRPGVDPAALRLVLLLAASRPVPQVVEVAARHAGHEDAGVRLAALVAILAADGDLAVDVLRRALTDPVADVSSMALGALAERFGRVDEARRHAVHVLATATVDTPDDALLPAIELIARHPGPASEQAEVVSAVQRVHEARREQAAFLGLGRRPSAHPAVAQAAERALAALGAGPSESARPIRASFFDRFRKP
jgi:hypothetical protein